MLFRVNAQSEAYEKALAEAGVPYVVRGAERFFERTEVRQAMVALRVGRPGRSPGETPLPTAVVEALAAVGWAPDAPPAGGAARERWEALAALVALAEEYAATRVRRSASARELGDPRLHDELARRAAQQHVPTVDGVTLASLHSAKGLEWDAVFLVGLAEGTLPTTYAKTAEQVEEERRLLYVGDHPGPAVAVAVVRAARSPGGRGPAAVAGSCRQLDRSGGTERAAAAAPARRRRRRAAPDADRAPAGSAAPPCSPARTASSAAARPARPTSTRSCYERLREWRQRIGRRAEGPGVRGLHRRHADRAGRAAAGPAARS